VTTETLGQAPAPPDAAPPPPESAPRARILARLGGVDRVDLAVVAFLVLGAVYVTFRFWLDPNRVVLRSNPGDQSFYEWMLAYQAHALTHFENPFYTYLQNAPAGVNLMCNASTPLVGWIVAPLTLLAGAHVAFGFVATFNLAATGVAWYYVLTRKMGRSRPAGLVGATFCAFAPGMISQTNAHLHMTAAYLVPFIVWRVTRLGEPGRVLRNGLVLGLLIAAQLLIGEETLLLTAIGLLVMVVVYAASRWTDARRMAKPFVTAMAFGALVTVTIDAYPLWMQFFGPNHAAGVPTVYGGDVYAFVSYAQQSIPGTPATALRVSPNPAEQSAFFGWGLSLLVLGVGIVLWRNLAARILFVTALACAVLSINNPVLFNGHRTGIPAPIGLVEKLPLMEALIIVRLGLVTMVATGLLLALLTDRVRDWARRAEPAGVPVRALAAVVGLAVLLPLVPAPLPTAPRTPAIPELITAERWRDHVEPGGTLVYAAPTSQTNLAWAAAAGAGYAIVQGYFLFPRSPDDTHARWETPARPTQAIMEEVMKGGRHTVTDADRAAAREDVRFWKADAVVLGAGEPNVGPLRSLTTELYGEPKLVGGAYVWDVRALRR
jgi:hypothetical protein